MSATDKDIKAKEDDISALLDDDIEHDDHDDSHLAVASSAADKRPGSPQVTPKKDSPEVTQDDDEEDINIHSSSTVPDAATAVPVAPVITPAAVTTPPAQAPPTQPATNPAQSEREARLAILTEAFPTVEKEVCEFVLESHRGNVEASINALLEISDPEFHAEPALAPQPVRAPAPAPAPIPAQAPPALPRRNDLEGQMGNLNLGGQNQQQAQHEIDPILLASTSTSEQQLRADEDFARTLAAMDEYRARDRQNAHGQNQQQQQQQQQQDEGPGFVAEMKELMDEELPKIKERFNVAADTTKKKVNEWYTTFKNNRAEAAARQQAQQQQQQQGTFGNGGSSQDGYYNDYSDRPHEPIRFGSRLDEEEPLSRNRTSPPLDGANPPLPSRPYNVNGASTDNSNNRATTVEDELQYAINSNPGTGVNMNRR
ncbi:hypothetical protein BGW39_005814 [Mortierella sp. 14UC]|nr:hypothetical protein BGW39_005814 [Mortierella sp. 14UC]